MFKKDKSVVFWNSYSDFITQSVECVCRKTFIMIEAEVTESNK